MKLIAGVILSLAILELIHCAPLIGSDDGSYKETHTSSSWGYNAGVNGGIGFEGGWKDGHGSLGIVKHIGVNVGGHKENDQKDIDYAIRPAPAPTTNSRNYDSQQNFYGSGFSSPYNHGTGSAYYMYAPQMPPQYPPQTAQQLQYVPQPIQQYPQWLQPPPQFAPRPHHNVQQEPQFAPQRSLLVAPQYALQGVQQ